VLIIILMASLVIVKTYADDTTTLGVRLIPDKIIENSDGIIEVYALHGGHIFPTKIEQVAFSSTNSTVVQTVGLDSNYSGFMTHIKIRANNPGTAKIVLAAPGFSSQEFPVTVYDDKNSPTNLVIKAAPSTFSSNGPKIGYFSIELTNSNGLPVYATTDIPITVATTDGKTLRLDTSQITIKSGQYYAIGKFEINQPGSAKIFASSPSFQSVSTTITSKSTTTPTIQAYVYPTKINDFASSIAYVVAVLKDSTGNLMLANNDTPISVTITNSTSTGLVNTSPQEQLFSSSSPIVIKKGDYVGYTPIQVRAGLNGTFNIRLSAPNGYTVSNLNSTGGLIQLKTVISQLLDDKSARLDLLPMSATGNTELIGIMHLEDSNGNPIIANKNLQIEVDSSDPKYLSIDPVNISRGVGAVPVFGKVGDIATPSPLSLHVITYNDTNLNTTINSLSTNSFKLVADSLIPNIMSQTDFPLVLYLIDSSGAVTYFPADYTPTVLSNDYFHVDLQKISSGDSVDLFNTHALKDGSSAMNIIAGNYPATISLTSASPVPSSIDLDYPTTLLANYSNFMGIQVLDLKSNPRFPDKETNIRLVSSNDSIIQFPSNITISKDNYYSTFEVNPKLPGSATISVLGDNLPLATYKVKVEDMLPSVTINSSTTVLPNESFFATIKAERYSKPLQNMNVDWKVFGANIQSSDKTTNKDGIASIALTSSADGVISINPTVSGQGFQPLTLKDIIKINSTQTASNGTNTNSTSSTTANLKSFKINGVDPLPFAIIGSIAVGGVLVKKKNMNLFKKNSVSTNNKK